MDTKRKSWKLKQYFYRIIREKTSKNLYFFTSSFPFGRGESFLENEILYLAKAFDNITIIPLYCYDIGGVIRNTPDNTQVLHPIIRSRLQHYFFGLFCLKTIHLYSKDFISKSVYKKIEWVKMFLIDFCTINNLMHSKTLRRVLQEIQKNDIMYFYWGKGASNLLPFLSTIAAKKVVRFHRGDLYDYLYDGYIPIQEEIVKKTDIAVFISIHGQNYLKNAYPHLQFNSVVSYLGTNDNGISESSNDNLFRLLSCSSVIPVKRLLLLFEALQSVTDYEIEWTHIGAGTDFEKLNNVVQNINNNLKVRLLGQISNQEVILFYQKNRIDAFINVSSSEGLPVSLMEAISFNVPVIGTDVGGTSEIVTPETGILLPSNPTISDIAYALIRIRHLALHPRLFWERNFNSAVNYPTFINQIQIS